MVQLVYIDTSVLVAAFCNEPQQPLALSILQDAQWQQVFVSDWTLAEFACAIQTKVLRGETPLGVARSIHNSLEQLVKTGALLHIAVLREDYKSVQKITLGLSCLVGGADALHLAIAARSGITHFASLDQTQRLAAGQWLTGVLCVPAASQAQP